VTGVDDALDDGDVGYTVVINAASSADAQYNGLNPGDLSATNADNDAASLSIASLSVSEAAGTADFTVTLAPASTGTVTVQAQTGNGTALAGSDYTAKTQTLSFAAGVTTQTFAVTLLNDSLDEPDETFTVTLSGATGGASIGTAQATGTIQDDDAAPTLSVSDAGTLNEGANAVFTVTLSAASAQVVTVSYATVNGTAVAPGDYTAIPSGTLTFNPGAPLTQDVTVTTINDNVEEDAETFSLVLSNPGNATLADDTGVATLSANDQDGVNNAVESQVPTPGGGTGDGNGDGVADQTQGHVASVQNAANQWVTVDVIDAVAPGETLSNITTSPAPADLPPRVTMPFGLVGFTANDVTAGGMVTVRIYVPETPRINTYWKRHKTTGQWTRVPVTVTLVGDQAPRKQRLEIVLQEGGPFDTDANPTTLTDPGGGGWEDGGVPIPTLGEWAQWLLVALMAALGVYRIRRVGPRVA
jgi:hypothetical protein